tara:strand:+ start:255 stop:725 length:471 start_codon:yes stop_codon:yes gene_type:complete
MTLDLFMLANYATGGAEPPISMYTAAFLMPVMVGLGALYRFPKSLASLICFGGACAIFGVVIWGIIDPMVSDKCPPGVNSTDFATGTCQITDNNKKTDRGAVLFLTFIWIGYPIVSLFDLRPATTYTYNKDSAYAVLDVTSKGGLALYAALRSTWL